MFDSGEFGLEFYDWNRILEIGVGMPPELES
jgi:hypothetical protein